MGCGESKHAVATENATVPKNKRSLSSKPDSSKDEKNVVKTENGVTEKVEKKELIAPKVVAASEKKEMVELEKATKDEVVEKEEEKIVEPKNANDGTAPVAVAEKKNANDAVAEKKNTNDETTPLVVEEKKESIQDIKPQDKNEEIIKPIEEEKEKEKEKEKEEASSASEATDAAKPETTKDADKPETEGKPKEENATATTDSKTD